MIPILPNDSGRRIRKIPIKYGQEDWGLLSLY
jgi:hypothetical protein